MVQGWPELRRHAVPVALHVVVVGEAHPVVMLAVHVVRHAVLLEAQARPLRQGAGVPGTHAFAVQALACISRLPAHEAGQSPTLLHCTHPFEALHTGVAGSVEQSVPAPLTQLLDALHDAAGVCTVPLHEPEQSETELHCTHPFAMLQTLLDIEQSVWAPAGHVPLPSQLAGAV
jgi:hypothetical protein